MLFRSRQRPLNDHSGTCKAYRGISDVEPQFMVILYICKAEGLTQKVKAQVPLPAELDQPLCFWIKGIKWDEAEVLDPINHLNFYMTYLDAKSPWILVHAPPNDLINQPRTRFVDGRFPSHIMSQNIDDTLLNFWEASKEGDPARRFLYSYKIIEYASHLYLERGVLSSIRRLLSSAECIG